MKRIFLFFLTFSFFPFSSPSIQQIAPCSHFSLALLKANEILAHPSGKFLKPEHIITYPQPILRLVSSYISNSCIQCYSAGQSKQLIVYIDRQNWTTSILIPAYNGILLYTDHVVPCLILIMILKDPQNQPYISLGHLLPYDVASQISHIIDCLKQQHFSPLEIIFSPHVTSGLMGCGLNSPLYLLQHFFQDTKILWRQGAFIASAFVSNQGWIIHNMITNQPLFQGEWKQHKTRLLDSTEKENLFFYPSLPLEKAL